MRRLQHFQFLPPNHILRALVQLEILYSSGMNDSHPVRKMLAYMRSTWVASTTHPLASWSQFGATIRTNNGVESFHRKINKIIGTRPHLYLFISSIESDAKGNIEQVLAEVFRRDMRPGQVKRDLQIQQLQQQYKDKALIMKDYLDKIARIYKPK